MSGPDFEGHFLSLSPKSKLIDCDHYFVDALDHDG